jgi:hypothetical protein
MNNPNSTLAKVHRPSRAVLSSRGERPGPIPFLLLKSMISLIILQLIYGVVKFLVPFDFLVVRI